MKWKEFNIAEFLIHQKKMGAPIANDLLFEKFTKILKQQQEQQQVAINNNNNMPTPNMNNNNKNLNNNNNNNYYNKNHNNPASSSSATTVISNTNNNVVAVAQAAAKAVSVVSSHPHQSMVATGVANNQLLREQMAARRSLSARLQQLQHPQLHQQQMHSMRPNVGHMASAAAGHTGGHHMIIVSIYIFYISVWD